MSEPASPMNTRAGWKLWRRKPRHAPASAAASSAAPPRLSESARIANVDAVIAPTPAARPSMPSMKLKLFISATIQSIVTGYCSAPRSSGCSSGSVRWSIVAPGGRPGWRRPTSSPANFAIGLISKRSSSRPTAAHTQAPSRIACARPAERRLQQQHRHRHGREHRDAAAERDRAACAGAGRSCGGRRARRARRPAPRAASARAPARSARPNATRASRRACVTGAPSA